MTLKPGTNRQSTFKTKSLTDFVNPGIKKCVYFADTGIPLFILPKTVEVGRLGRRLRGLAPRAVAARRERALRDRVRAAAVGQSP